MVFELLQNPAPAVLDFATGQTSRISPLFPIFPEEILKKIGSLQQEEGAEERKEILRLWKHYASDKNDIDNIIPEWQSKEQAKIYLVALVKELSIFIP